VTIQQMHNVGIVVDDLKAAIAFFVELGMELEGEGQVEGVWADRAVGLDGIRCNIAMMRTPDGQGRLELSQYLSPALLPSPTNQPHNILGTHRVMYSVDDIDDTIARLSRHGGELIGEVSTYNESVRLCYFRGPAGIIIGLSEYK
jgi:catechol 2,3-dioxygenase-like lactoylglutathione lyase family enzyme